ncbi:ASCH domain-containing protein [Flavobacterium chryseum]|uniref:ASCH domain-containing protein n=1 Tax=Flavobacterium sp. P3160 TaxID=2512113 RepID=UPI00105D2182|nr:ASCH domain-containing protein [Flavobacterium sp. P3160]TDO68842.1 ASCH domain-containing protein [Flavobacterium sp. P3160]
MRALSIKQPYASLIANGIKNIENRTWRTNFRGRIYIHASAKIVDVEFSTGQTADLYLNNIWYPGVGFSKEMKVVSAIIGEVDIIDCVVNHSSIWAEKLPYCPITGKPFFMKIESENGEMVNTYGGPFDSYTIPVPDETCKGEYITQRYCHDSGSWVCDESITKTIGIPKTVCVNINVNYYPVIGKFDLTNISTRENEILRALKEDPEFSKKYFNIL